MKNQKFQPCSPAINNPSKTKFKYFLDGGERIIPVNKIKTPSYKFIFGIYFDNKRIGEIEVKLTML